MPDFNPKRLLERLDKAADNLERTVTRKAKATYQNGKDIIRADRNIENDTPTLRPEDRLEERSELSRVISGLDREQRYMHASDKRVLAAEARARRKFTRESSAVVSSSAVAGGSVLLTAKTAGTTSKLAALKLSTAAKHTGKAANNFARFSVIESERIRRRLPAPEIDHGAEFKTGLRNGFVNRLQAEAMSKLGMGALHEVDHAIDGEALRARALDALASRVPSESYAGHHIAEARATPYAGPVRTPGKSCPCLLSIVRDDAVYGSLVSNGMHVA
jgi:hypothetical protein